VMSTYPLCLSVPLGKDAHDWARRFAAQQATPEKGKQVYLNTLAVYAVHSYLKWLAVETALTKGDSWHPGLRAIFDVADLVLPHIGKLECRPVLPGEVSFVLPAEVIQNRIGYVAVQFHQQLDAVELLGFAPALISANQREKISVAQLEDLDVLIDTIHQRSLSPALQPQVRLRQWLEGIFSEEWQPTGLVLASNFRSTANLTHLELDSQCKTVSRAKVIDLGVPLAPHPVVLVVQLTATTPEEIAIRLRLYPGDQAIHLPPNLQLILLDTGGNPCMEAKSRSADDWMQLEFSCQPQEQFSVNVVFDKMKINEQFVV